SQLGTVRNEGQGRGNIPFGGTWSLDVAASVPQYVQMFCFEDIFAACLTANHADSSPHLERLGCNGIFIQAQNIGVPSLPPCIYPAASTPVVPSRPLPG